MDAERKLLVDALVLKQLLDHCAAKLGGPVKSAGTPPANGGK